ncbi:MULTISPECIES: divergent polysaccharide deacetylase family protein [unclassified Yoonia]|uniref:divergent polysaccharide deacetylase family protein n=1 Tax=unclassified Yoonia TaxID=2629118 RepID=UPI002AFFCCB5|nr:MULTISPECIES: divergent polysaccharide deacetylase family protein [unclassified Yoonia]
MAFVLGGTGLVVASLTAEPPVLNDPVPVAVVPPPAAVEPEPEVVEQPDLSVPVPPVAPQVESMTNPPEPAVELPEPEDLQPDPPKVAVSPPSSVENLPAPAAEPAPPPAPAVRVNRPGTEPEPELVEDMGPATPPLMRYAAVFDYAADLPLVAVVLMDDPAMRDAPAVIASLPFVPTMVLNAAAPDVTERMRAYRAAGIEVVLEARLPQGARPSNIEVTYQAAFTSVPEAIAVFSDGTGPEADGVVADQVMQWVAADGRGFVSMPRGLDAMRPAATGDAPTALISREIDGAGETQAAIERNLAQASFRARQTGDAVVLGHATHDTLAALRSWANRSDPAQMSLVPVSAVLIAQLPPP